MMRPIILRQGDEMDKRNLTDADVAAIAKAITSSPEHQCRFRGIDTEEFEKAWPNMRDVAISMDTGKKVAIKIIITGVLMAMFGAIAAGLKTTIIGWITPN